MCYAQEFPATVEEWMESNKIVDTEHIYTNGSEMVPIFRMRQWFQHVATIKPRPRGRWINHRKDRGHNIADCDKCGGTLQWLDPDERPNFCPNCGADMKEVSE